MGKKDIGEKNLEQYEDVFSDIVNALLYCGNEVVKEENMHPAPTETFYKANGEWRQQFQDICMYEYRDEKVYVQYTIENQTEEDGQMILRKAGYEGAAYRSQYERGEYFGLIRFWSRWKRKKKERKGLQCVNCWTDIGMMGLPRE